MATRLSTRVPLWGKMLALLAASAGIAAIGAGITGDNPVKVNEPITFDSESGISGDSRGNGAEIYNDDTSMTVSAFTYSGDTYQLNLVLNNQSDVRQAARMMIDAPEGFRFSDAAAGHTHYGGTADIAELIEDGSASDDDIASAEDCSEGAGTVLCVDFTSAPLDSSGVAIGNLGGVELDPTTTFYFESELLLEIGLTAGGYDTGDALTITWGDGHAHEVGAAEDSRVAVVQEGNTVFTFTLDAEADGDSDLDALTLEVEVLPQVIPGWYSISFETEALSTNLDNVG